VSSLELGSVTIQARLGSVTVQARLGSTRLLYKLGSSSTKLDSAQIVYRPSGNVVILPRYPLGDMAFFPR
jgi:hypothetical protein